MTSASTDELMRGLHVLRLLPLGARQADVATPAPQAAVFVQLARGFGQFIDLASPAVDRAVFELERFRAGASPHREVLVQACAVMPRPPIGVKRLDDALQSTGRFVHGTARTDFQHSISLAPYGRLRERDGRYDPGELRAHQLREALAAPWLNAIDRHALADIERRVIALGLDAQETPALDHGLTLVRVVHPVSKASLSQYAPAFVTHGWLLVGDRGELHAQIPTDETKTGRRLMAIAALDLAFDRIEGEVLLRIEDGQVTRVAPAVAARCQPRHEEGREPAAVDQAGEAEAIMEAPRA